MDNEQSNLLNDCSFASRIKYELKRAERYRVFVSLVVFNVGSIFDVIDRNKLRAEGAREGFLKAVNTVIRQSVREIDAVSNNQKEKIGILCPETSRQGAEAAARRIQDALKQFCSDHFGNSGEYLIPVEIASFPDAAGTRSIASYFDEYTPGD
jgi:GGDEF domain-containing protein